LTPLRRGFQPHIENGFQTAQPKETKQIRGQVHEHEAPISFGKSPIQANEMSDGRPSDDFDLFEVKVANGRAGVAQEIAAKFRAFDVEVALQETHVEPTNIRVDREVR
jgi:hypothetical protein